MHLVDWWHNVDYFQMTHPSAFLTSYPDTGSHCFTLSPSPKHANTLTPFLYIFVQHRYKILCPKLIKEPITPEKATEKILESTGLDSESFRLGRTKVA